MTIIAACIDAQGNAAIASDSLGSTSAMKADYGTKLHTLTDDILVGTAGCYVLQQWARRHLRDALVNDEGAVPVQHERLWPRLEDAWQKWLTVVKSRTEAGAKNLTVEGTAMVVLTRTHIYICEADGAVQVRTTYAAHGSGTYIAMGALWLATQDERAAEHAVRGAVLAACEHNPFCGGKIHVLHLATVTP